MRLVVSVGVLPWAAAGAEAACPGPERVAGLLAPVAAGLVAVGPAAVAAGPAVAEPAAVALAAEPAAAEPAVVKQKQMLG